MNSQNDKRPLRILSANDLYNINEEVTGHAPFVRDLRVLQATVSRPYLILFGEEQFPSLLDKAAATLHSLAYRHPFVDGNKRTALVLTRLFLALNGAAFTASAASKYETMVQLAAGDLSEDAFAAWVRAHAG